MIGEQCWQWLRLHRGTSRAPVYGYLFRYASPYTPVASHVTEIPFVFVRIPAIVTGISGIVTGDSVFS